MSHHAPWEVQRKLLVKLNEETDPSYGQPPTKRSIDQHIRFGLIDLDKPSGPSSHEVVAWVKRMMGLKHAGHGGTLETQQGSERSNGHGCSASSTRRSDKNDSGISSHREGIRLSHGPTRRG